MESHENSPRLPAIKVMVALGQEDLSIRVRDPSPALGEGGSLGRGDRSGVVTAALSPDE